MDYITLLSAGIFAPPPFLLLLLFFTEQEKQKKQMLGWRSLTTVKQTILCPVQFGSAVVVLYRWRPSGCTVAFVFAQEFMRLPLVSSDSKFDVLAKRLRPQSDGDMNCFVFPRSYIACNGPSV